MQVLRLPFDHHTDGASLRHAAQPRLIGWQAAELIDDTLLVITELVHNVIQHTGDGGEVTISRPCDVVRVEVFDHSQDLPQLLKPAPERIGGRGIMLVDAVSQEWGSRLTPTGKVVWAHLPIRLEGTHG
jgi:anti-sigma regulatory factor (Ser/Thr protein kinase)